MDKARMTSFGFLALLAFSIGSYAATRSTPVTVVNTDGEPVPVAAIDASAPVNACAILGPFSGAEQLIYSVPPDMALAIEYGAIDPVDTLDEGEFVQVQITTTAGGVEGVFFVGKVSGSEFTFGRDGRVLKIYADPGTDVVGGVGIRGYLGDVEICLSGRLSPVD
ncbi:MAG: hypothetical protein QNJ91_11585 [Gammaproteobacteria bacterium]|nr:hypothetical protein [Gammaproteobacteria bacterium]